MNNKDNNNIKDKRMIISLINLKKIIKKIKKIKNKQINK